MLFGFLVFISAATAYGAATNEERFFIVSEKELSLSEVHSDITGTPSGMSSGMPSGMATGTGIPTGNPTGVPTPTFTNPPVGDRFKFLATITLYFAVTNYQYPTWMTESTGAMKIALMKTLESYVLIIYSTLQVRGLSVSRRMLGEAAVVGQQSTTAYVTASFEVWLDSSCLSNANNVLSSVVSILESSITDNFSGVLAGCGFVIISKSVGGSYLVECSPSSAPTIPDVCVPCLSLPGNETEAEGADGGPGLPKLAPPVRVHDIVVKDIKISKKLKGHSAEIFQKLLPSLGFSAPVPSPPQIKLLPAPLSGTLDVLLYASNNNGTSSWWRADGLGAYYEITDKSGSIVYYVGTLCPGEPADSSCDISLRPGEFVFHVSGGAYPDDNDLSWQFCASNGGVETSLIFSVGPRGECVPMTVSVLSEDVDSSSQMDVVYEGTFQIFGLQGSSLSDYDILVLENTMTNILAEAGASSVTAAVVVSYQSLSSNSDVGSGLVTFRVATGIDEHADAAFEQSVGNTISSALENSLSDGSFVSTVVSQARNFEQLSGLLSVSAGKLVSFERVENAETKIEKLEASAVNMTGSYLAVVGAVIIVVGVIVGIAHRRVFVGVTQSSKLESVVPESVPLQSLHTSMLGENAKRGNV